MLEPIPVKPDVAPITFTEAFVVLLRVILPVVSVRFVLPVPVPELPPRAHVWFVVSTNVILFATRLMLLS